MALLPIVLILLIVTLLLFLILRDFGMVSKKQKILSVIALIIVASLIGVYSYNKSQNDKKTFLLQMAFLRGETLVCKEKEVSAKNFNLVSGTLSLIGRKNTDFHNVVFSLEECEQKQKDQDSKSIQEQLGKD